MVQVPWKIFELWTYASGCVGCGYQWCTVVVEKTSHLVGILSKGADASLGGLLLAGKTCQEFSLPGNFRTIFFGEQNKEVVLVGDVLHSFLFSF